LKHITKSPGSERGIVCFNMGVSGDRKVLGLIPDAATPTDRDLIGLTAPQRCHYIRAHWLTPDGKDGPERGNGSISVL
jgi:hypothetical protein